MLQFYSLFGILKQWPTVKDEHCKTKLQGFQVEP